MVLVVAYYGDPRVAVTMDQKGWWGTWTGEEWRFLYRVWVQ
jgi:hypothetical protein